MMQEEEQLSEARLQEPEQSVEELPSGKLIQSIVERALNDITTENVETEILMKVSSDEVKSVLETLVESKLSALQVCASIILYSGSITLAFSF